jgi:hypothetical protein
MQPLLTQPLILRTRLYLLLKGSWPAIGLHELEQLGTHAGVLRHWHERQVVGGRADSEHDCDHAAIVRHRQPVLCKRAVAAV